ncbi:hypothetical protein ADL21_11090 [Streptomyces albus subsp. albus]|nr:hypothetical protein ADL21_11090 [Streptomyces albus subsp. albus]
MPPSAGYAVLQVIPAVRGISEELRQQLVAPAGDAGDRAGAAAGSGLKQKIRAGAAAAGALAGSLLAAGIGKALEQANVSSTLQAQLGTTNKVAAQHGKIAGRLYSSGVSGSFQEAADAIKSVVQAGLAPPGTTTGQLQVIATKAQDVASVFGQDLGGVTNAVSQLMRTGLAKSSGEAFDLITKGFQSGADKGGDLLDTVNEYGVQFRKAGLTGADAMGLINQAIAAGARDSDVAADAIKEFSIRAVDGSASTKQGFQALGLSADDMAAKFGKGGATSKAVLDLTLDRLRAIKDPVKQAQIATALFGTQAEDLGASLLAMDPSKAARSLGAFGGAADRVGKTIRSGPSYAIQTFRRTLAQGLTTFLGGQVIPALTRFGDALRTVLLPVVRAAAGPVRALFSALTGSPGAMQATAIAVSLLAGGMVTLRIATMARTGVQSLWGSMVRLHGAARTGVTQVRALAFATRYYSTVGAQAAGQALRTGAAWVASGARAAGAWTIARARATLAFAQTSLSATAHAGRSAWSWVASAARSAGAWTAARARTVASFAQTSASATLHAGRSSAAWVASAARSGGAWAATRARATAAFAQTSAAATASAARTSGVWVAAQMRMLVATARSTGALVVQRGALIATGVAAKTAAVGQRLLNAAMRANPIGIIITLLVAIGVALVLLYRRSATFRSVVQAAMRGVMVAVRALGAAGLWLYHYVLLPVFRGIRTAAAVWWAGMKVIFAAVRAAIRGVGAVFTFWRDVVRAVFRTVVGVIRAAWSGGGISSVFEALKRGIAAVRNAFRAAVTAVGRIWAELRAKTKGPVQFIIDVVYNKGIRGLWNTAAKVLPLKKLPEVKLATGGPVFGAGSATSDSVPALLSRGEHVWTAAEVEGAGGHRKVEALRARARRSGATFAKGGVVGGIGDWFGDRIRDVGGFLGKAKDWVLGGIHKAASFAARGVKAMIDRIPGGKTGFGQLATAIPKKLIDAALDFILGSEDSAGGGEGVSRALQWARSQAGKPYQWGGAGDPSWDCSGFMSGIQKVIQGQNPEGRLWSTFSFQGSRAPAGWKRNLRSPFMIGVTNRGKGHTAGTLAGVNVESRGGDGVLVGSRARGYRDPMFQARYGFVPALAGGGAGATAGARATARQMLGEFGWSQEQWPPLDQLWSRESGWRWNARNPSSGAYGIPQALPADKMRSAGDDWRTNPATQIRWGLGYIKGRYGSPAAAWSFWNRQRPHWYDDGGALPPGLSLAYNGTRRPERVLNERQWAALTDSARRDDGARFEGELVLDSGEFLGTVQGVLAERDRQLATALRAGRR